MSVFSFASVDLQKDFGETYVTLVGKEVGVIMTLKGHLEMSKLRVTEGQPLMQDHM